MTFSFADLIDAWRGFRRWGEHESELGEYHRSRYEAFSTAFGADLNLPPDPAPAVPEWLSGPRRPSYLWERDVHRFVLATEATASRLTDPWEGMLEGSEPMVNIYQRYQRPVKAGVADARKTMLEMSNALLAELYPATAARSISDSDLRIGGFDPSREEPSVWDDF